MSEKIICKINDTPSIYVKFGKQGLRGNTGPTGPTGATGPSGPSDHSQLTHLDYDNAGHTNFQKKLTYVPEYKCYEVE